MYGVFYSCNDSSDDDVIFHRKRVEDGGTFLERKNKNYNYVGGSISVEMQSWPKCEKRCN